jgi:hypothetical protein
VPECDTCQIVKTDYLRPTGNLQPLNIPEWKWEDIYMDFIVDLPHTSCGYNSIWVIVDCLTKSVHFIPVSTTHRVRQYAELYLSHIIRYHDIPKTIISDRGSIFIAHFWGVTIWVFGHPSHLKLSLSPPDWQTDCASQSNHWRYASYLCSDGWSEIGQTPSTSWVLI